MLKSWAANEPPTAAVPAGLHHADDDVVVGLIDVNRRPIGSSYGNSRSATSAASTQWFGPLADVGVGNEVAAVDLQPGHLGVLGRAADQPPVDDRGL